MPAGRIDRASDDPGVAVMSPQTPSGRQAVAGIKPIRAGVQQKDERHKKCQQHPARPQHRSTPATHPRRSVPAPFRIRQPPVSRNRLADANAFPKCHRWGTIPGNFTFGRRCSLTKRHGGVRIRRSSERCQIATGEVFASGVPDNDLTQCEYLVYGVRSRSIALPKDNSGLWTVIERVRRKLFANRDLGIVFWREARRRHSTCNWFPVIGTRCSCYFLNSAWSH